MAQLPNEIRYKLKALERSVPVRPWSSWTIKGRTMLELRKQIAAENIPAIKEVLKDWRSFTEDL
ncbi:hypothetical protein [Massilia endophytica]|uniref:hypothetical protein n=1 Tax=Massilia endophytica TaxID=2899220 RepID=UPI001E56D4B4|nr:hypothetical protein [Massilia endophytica]UGQ44706.1 hypothetical protein LSQ66_12920 [Massilia endophytica]